MPTTPDERFYLLTFRTYGSWLHGDARGSVNRRSNVLGTPRLPPVPGWESWQRAQMREPEVVLSEEQRRVVTQSVEATCRGRGWRLVVVNVRTNHVHAVIGTTAPPETVTNDLKAFATRALRKAGLTAAAARVWSRGGSRKQLLDARAVEAACRYVVEGQGSELGMVPDEE